MKRLYRNQSEDNIGVEEQQRELSPRIDSIVDKIQIHLNNDAAMTNSLDASL